MLGDGTVLRFRVLGPLELFDGVTWTTVTAAKQRALLAALVAQAPGAVSTDALIDEVWGERPPKTAQTQIHGYVMRLRRLLDDPDGHLLVTSPPGYRLQIDQGDIDADLAEALVDDASAALRDGLSDEAATAATDALAYWRGEPYADVELSTLVAPRAERLRELRLTAQEELVAADLARERYDAVASGARAYLVEHPLREQVWQHLMSALWSSGRQAEALECYRTLRHLLADELGVDPCQEVRELHARILAGEAPPPCGSKAEAPTSGAGRRTAYPELSPMSQLPADIGDFTGREAEIAEVVGAIEGAEPDQPPSIVVVHGAPGAGKSSVALHAARQLAERFPDGQLYLDAAGTSASAREPSDLVAEVLVALGISGHGIPDGIAPRAALLRSVLVERRFLILVDDAGAAEQVMAVLPPTGGSAVIVSSRRLLTDLPGSRHVELSPLGPREAYDLLARIVGPSRVAGEAETAHQITRACGYLPLSIRIAGGKLLGRPRWSLQVLLARLEDESRRLSELRLGDLDVRSSVDLSLRSLEPEAQRAFSLMGLLGAYDVPGWVLGPLLDTHDAEDVLDTLVDANLVALTTSGPDGQPRYRLHDLLRVHAVDSCGQIPVEEQREAMARVLSSWLDLAEQATQRLPPNPLVPPRGDAPRRPLPDYQTRAVMGQPLAWFDAERTALLGVIRLAVEWELTDLCWELAAALVPYFDDRAQYDDWRRTHELALQLPLAEVAEAAMLRGLAQVHIYRSEFEEAEDLAGRALALFRRVGHQHGEAMAVAATVTSHRLAGRLSQAYDQVQKALALVAPMGDRTFEAHLRCSAGTILVAQGRVQESNVWFRQALRIAREDGDVHREAVVLRELSQMQHQVGDSQAALVGLRRAEEILEGLQDERCIAFTLARRARIHADTGEVDDALASWATAATTFRRNGTLADEATCYRSMADLEHGRGDDDAARRHLRRASDLWHAVGHHEEAADSDSVLIQLSA